MSGLTLKLLVGYVLVSYEGRSPGLRYPESVKRQKWVSKKN